MTETVKFEQKRKEMKKSIHIYVLELYQDEKKQHGYLQSRLRALSYSDKASLFYPDFQFDLNSLKVQRESCKKKVLGHIFPPEQAKRIDQAPALKEIECGMKQTEAVYPLFEGETMTSYCWTYFPERFEIYEKGTPLLLYKTNQSYACLVFRGYRYSDESGRVRHLKPPMEQNIKSSVSDMANIVNQSIKLTMGVYSGKPDKILSAVFDFANFLSGLSSPAEEPLTVQLQEIVHDEITEAFMETFHAGINEVSEWLNNRYYPTEKKNYPPEGSTIEEKQRMYDLIDRKIDDVAKLRSTLEEPNFCKGGMALYIAAQNLLNLLYDEMAQYDPKAENKYQSNIYKSTIPLYIRGTIKHIQTLWPELKEDRMSKIKLEKYTFVSEGFCRIYYWCEDPITGYKSPQLESKSSIESIVNGLKELAGDQLYTELMIRDSIDAWMTQVDWPTEKKSPLDIMYTENKKFIYSDSGTGAVKDIAVYRPKPPKGYFTVGDYANASGWTAEAKLLCVKENEPGCLLKPLDYEKIWDDKGSGGKHQGSFWKPKCPEGYVALGDVANNSRSKPDINKYRVVRQDLAEQAGYKSSYDDEKSGADKDLAVWSLYDQIGPYPSRTFVSTNRKQPTGRCWQLKGFYWEDVRVTNLPDTPDDAYLESALDCSCLLNVANQMAKDWIKAGCPSEKDFIWQPSDPCPFTKDLFKKFDFADVKPIWAEVVIEKPSKTFKEPFFFMFTRDDTTYIVFRGTETEAYKAAREDDSEAVCWSSKVLKGYYQFAIAIVANSKPFKKIPRDKNHQIVICGHGVGSVTAVFAALLTKSYSPKIKGKVRVFLQACPKFSDVNFARINEFAKCEIYQLINTEDAMPKERNYPWVHVGKLVQFTADYNGDQSGKNHEACKTYAYALRQVGIEPYDPINKKTYKNNMV